MEEGGRMKEKVDRPCMIRGHVAASNHMDRDDLENQPFEGKGGLGKMYQLSARAWIRCPEYSEYRLGS